MRRMIIAHDIDLVIERRHFMRRKHGLKLLNRLHDFQNRMERNALIANPVALD